MPAANWVFRTDKSFAVQDGLLTLRTRFAWAHDFDPDRSIAATSRRCRRQLRGQRRAQARELRADHAAVK